MIYLDDEQKAAAQKFIINPVTDDLMTGYDEYRQFWIGRLEHERIVWSQGRDLRGQACQLCGQKWTASSESLIDQQHDEGAKTHVHVSCTRRVNAFEQRKKLIDWLSLAWMFHDRHGKNEDRPEDCYVYYKLETIKNKYWPDTFIYNLHATPWYSVNFEGAQPVKIEFGRRKRVWSMRFQNLTLGQIDQLEAAFADVGDTKMKEGDSYLIHAYTAKQVVRYLTAFREIVFGKLTGRGVEVVAARMKEQNLTDTIPEKHALQAIDHIFRAAHGAQRELNKPTANFAGTASAVVSYADEFKELGYTWHPDEEVKVRYDGR